VDDAGVHPKTSLPKKSTPTDVRPFLEGLTIHEVSSTCPSFRSLGVYFEVVAPPQTLAINLFLPMPKDQGGWC